MGPGPKAFRSGPGPRLAGEELDVGPAPKSEHYPNTSPETAYVGDRACVACHEEISHAYSSHPMGRSLAVIGDRADVGIDGESGVLFEADGLEYEVERLDGRVVHSESRTDASGTVVGRTALEVSYALGSGTRGVSFLVERGEGFLYQSPISWYAQRERWDLAPGYRADNPHFQRPITADCLYCHAGRVDPVPGAENHYEPPVFLDLAISCERCHGPGQLHVESLGDVDAEGRATIVNPADLEPTRREAVCQQCHLSGEVRVARLGRDPNEFRPGLALDAFLATFVRVNNGPAGSVNEAVGHTEQMVRSLCFEGSGGQLGCISCHDPHRLPDPADRISYYRDRCLNCHGDRSSCALPEADRLVRNPENDCISCHMPRSPLADIAHTAQTLHSIPREVQSGRETAPSPSALPYGLAVFEGSLDPGDLAESTDRELGIARARIAREKATPLQAGALARDALPRLGRTVVAQPADSEAWEALASALIVLGRQTEALEALERSLASGPTESALDEATILTAGLGQADRAIAFNQRLLEVNPTRSDYHFNRAQLLAYLGRWDAVADSCREAIRLAPTDQDARLLLDRRPRRPWPRERTQRLAPDGGPWCSEGNGP